VKKTFSVIFTPEAEEHLVALYQYIATHGSPVVAARYTEAIVAYCEGSAAFPIVEHGATTFAQDCASPTTNDEP
jgi:plasmid stabilization system protein ParE